MKTGYEIREGSAILATRRAEQERCAGVAEAMWRRALIAQLAGEALRLLDEGKAA